MTPSARVRAAIELLDEIESAPLPADQVVQAYMRGRRYVGSKDRRAISAMVFEVVRQRVRLDWALTRAGYALTTRNRVIAALTQSDRASRESLAQMFDGIGYGASALTANEVAMADAMREAGGSLYLPRAPQVPDHVRGNYPLWLDEELRRTFGDDIVAEMAAFAEEAPTDLRVNTRRVAPGDVRAALESMAAHACATPWAPAGVRVRGRPQLSDSPQFRDGRFEIQDEGAQLAAGLVDVKSARLVIDYCAGAGGKALALADLISEQARLVACDVDSKRLARLTRRAARAGLSIETILVDEVLTWPATGARLADRVLVDVPCTGTGTWRRDPDGRRRLTSADLARWVKRQGEILSAAQTLVAPGGRLVYVTCSVLRAENADQIERFLACHSDFVPIDVGTVWRRVFRSPCPHEGPSLQLTPRRHGTDGFFIAILQRLDGSQPA